ncbi:MAG TPA: hypothetical protein PL027_09830 [Thermosynergistes sp.]|nr:hypothetical protein [Thermosynergistes sp.]
MDFVTGGTLCVLLLLALMATGLQIGLAFILSGFLISSLLIGVDGTLSLLGQAAYFSIATPTWTCIPLFTLMGLLLPTEVTPRGLTTVYMLSPEG